MIKFVILVAIVFLISVIGIGAYLSPDSLAKCELAPSEKVGCQKADAIIALSGGNTRVRTQWAIDLYQRGWADTLIFSGAAKDTSGPSNAEAMRTQAIAEGVPKSDIITEDLSQTTHQNAQKTNRLIEKYAIDRLIIVTSPYHQRRASIEFDNAVRSSLTIVNSPAKNDPDWPWYWWATPRGWWLAGSELVKILLTHAGESR